MTTSPVLRFVQLVRKRREETSLDSAVFVTAQLNPQLTVEVLDIIGSWPSSEPELASLQRQWGGA